MNTFVTNLKKMLHDFFTSKKVLTAILTSVVQALPDTVIAADTKKSILVIGGILLGGQGLADFGKSKALAGAQNSNPAAK